MSLKEFMQLYAKQEKDRKTLLAVVRKLSDTAIERHRQAQVDALPFLLLPPRGQA
jgi:hypothetical protein